MKKSKDFSFIIIPIGFVSILAFSALYIVYLGSDFRFGQNVSNNVITKIQPRSPVAANPTTGQQNIAPAPAEVNLPVPFTSQAPGGDWSGPFEHTCEEASVLMVQHYLAGEQFTSVDETKSELLGIVNFENQKYGFSDDTNTDQTARFARDYYSYDVNVVYDITLDDIKNELDKGNPVIVPTAGRLLGNPNYTGLGPLYHMLVIKGYTATQFITNDAGTRNGADYRYTYSVLQNAIHDWSTGDVYTGRTAMIVITR